MTWFIHKIRSWVPYVRHFIILAGLCLPFLQGRSADAQLPPGVIAVDALAPGVNNGNSWTDAYVRLQDALKRARDFPGTVSEIWVAKRPANPYKPDQGAGLTLGDRSLSFSLVVGVKIYGGFTPPLDTLATRDKTGAGTILSGEISQAGYDDNSFHVVTAFGPTSPPFMTPDNTWLDGFTIQEGNGNGDGLGGGLGGGGMLLADNGNARILNSVITNNRSGTDVQEEGPEFTSNHYGAGIQTNSASPVFINSVISNNQQNPTLFSIYGGGIVAEFGGTPKFISCTITQNMAGRGGGIAVKYGTTAHLINSLIVGNWTDGGTSGGNLWGGGISVDRGASVVIKDCTIAMNTATRGGGFALYENGTGFLCTIENTVLWGNTATQGQGAQIYFPFGGGTLEVRYSDVQGGPGGIGGGGQPVYANNLDVDPLFYNPIVPDGNFRLRCGSPVRNQGSNALVPCDEFDINGDTWKCQNAPPNAPQATPDRDRKTRVADAVVDMGCYERLQDGICQGDVDASGFVNVNDLLLVINGWGPCPAPPQPCNADVSPSQCGTGDGQVNINDLLVVINSWGPCPGAPPSEPESLPSTVQDCWNSCTAKYPDDVDKWYQCFDACVDSLCKRGLLNCP